jgi:hypothetical protein
VHRSTRFRSRPTQSDIIRDLPFDVIIGIPTRHSTNDTTIGGGDFKASAHHSGQYICQKPPETPSCTSRPHRPVAEPVLSEAERIRTSSSRPQKKLPDTLHRPSLLSVGAGFCGASGPAELELRTHDHIGSVTRLIQHLLGDSRS